eukprot:s1537_g5.t1
MSACYVTSHPAISDADIADRLCMHHHQHHRFELPPWRMVYPASASVLMQKIFSETSAIAAQTITLAGTIWFGKKKMPIFFYF